MGFLDKLGIGKKKEEKMMEMLQRGAIVVDVRSPGEFASGHLEGSINIPLQSIGNKANELKKKNKPVILCCASGMRSGSATSLLKAQGVECMNGGSWSSL